jgi:catechol 2,3-dioxygenase-like lactoylglutathione lyase family enzyme
MRRSRDPRAGAGRGARRARLHGRTYELGTAYGHIALVVADLDATLAALADQGIEPERPPYSVREDGSLLTFVRDPVNGYRIELIGARSE